MSIDLLKEKIEILKSDRNDLMIKNSSGNMLNAVYHKQLGKIDNEIITKDFILIELQDKEIEDHKRITKINDALIERYKNQLDDFQIENSNLQGEILKSKERIKELEEFVKEMKEYGGLAPQLLCGKSDIIYHGAKELLSK